MVKKSTIVWLLLLTLLVTSTIPYLAYGVTVVRSGVEVIGALNGSEIAVGKGVASLFSYVKDIIACLLLAVVILFSQNHSRKLFVLLFLIALYGCIGLFLNGHFQVGFLIAGFRTFLFFIVMILVCTEYQNNLYDDRWIKKVITITQCVVVIQTMFVALQITWSSSWGRFGSGAYRYSGLFPGSGNLGCYAVAALLLLTIMNQKYRMINGAIYIIDSVLLMFLSIASGTRTCMILVAFIMVYNLFMVYGSALHMSKSIIAVSLIIVVLIFGSYFITAIISWTGRGVLMDSGSGRIEALSNMLNTASFTELLFGRGLGVGTNASITMGLSGTSVSDSTINLLFTQFGIVGLIFWSGLLVGICRKLYLAASDFKHIALSMIATIVVMYVVGNLFEHIGMIIYLILSYFYLTMGETDKADETEMLRPL